jgi:hypothetical protein
LSLPKEGELRSPREERKEGREKSGQRARPMLQAEEPFITLKEMLPESAGGLCSIRRLEKMSETVNTARS